MSKIFITGAAGFIGTNLVKELSKKHELTINDRNLNPVIFSHALFSNNINLYKCELQECLKKNKEQFDYIIHLAHNTDTRINDVKEMMKSYEDFRLLLKKYPNTKMIYASSAAVYGDGPSPMTETQQRICLNAYAFSKVMMENIANTNCVGLRFFNVYGKHEENKVGYNSMIYQLNEQIKKGKKPRIFWDGQQARDHIYVKDVVEAIKKAMKYKGYGVFNVGTGKATTFNNIIELIDKNAEIKYIKKPYAKTYQNITQADTKLAKKELKFEAQWSIKKGIHDYIKHI